jgi:hypothetical protein
MQSVSNQEKFTPPLRYPFRFFARKSDRKRDRARIGEEKKGGNEETHGGWISYVALHDRLVLDIVDHAALIRAYNEIS